MVEIRHLTRQLLFKSALKIGDCPGSSNHHRVVNLYFMVEGTRDNPVFEKSFPFFKPFDSQSPWSSLRAASSKPTGCRSGILSRRMGASIAWRQSNLLCFFLWWDIVFFPGWELTELTPQEENEGMNKHNNEPMLNAKACQNWGSSPPWQVLPMYTPLDENSTLGQTKRIERMAVWIEILKQKVAVGFFVLPT